MTESHDLDDQPRHLLHFCHKLPNGFDQSLCCQMRRNGVYITLYLSDLYPDLAYIPSFQLVDDGSFAITIDTQSQSGYLLVNRSEYVIPFVSHKSTDTDTGLANEY